MSLALTIRAWLLLVRETFRRACATRLFWLMVAASAVCIGICLSVGIEGGGPLRNPEDIELYGGDGQPLAGPNPRPGRLTLAFGAFGVTLFRDGPAMVHFLQVVLAKWIAGAAGVLLALIWTAGFIPEFLERSEAAVLLTKPVSRSALLWAKAAGALAFVGVQAVLFIGGTYLALGIRTGVWAPAYLWSIPLLCVHFAMIYGVSVALAVWTRNTAAAALGSIACWLVCFAVNSGRDALAALPTTAVGVASERPALGWTVEAAYWLLPKPVDVAALLDRALDADAHFRTVAGFGTTPDARRVSTLPVVGTSLAFALAMLLGASRSFERLEY